MFESNTEDQVRLVDTDYVDAAAYLDVEVAAIKAVDEVESGGDGFLPDGKLKILFEGHIFYKYTNGKYASSNPDICYPTWTSKFYARGTTQERGDAELAKLSRALKLDRRAALMSASYGRYQVMGFNFALCGFKDVEAFVNSMKEDETNHLKAFVGYVEGTGLQRPLRNLDWDEFARRYNGPGYKKNLYDTKLAKAYNKYRSEEA